MANKNVEQFVATYGPVAVQVSKEINVDPNLLLSQWGSESRWGQTEMAKKHHNLGGIKDFSGQGFEAKDNKTGSLDKYVKFEDPEVFGMYYADQIKRNFPGAVNTGPDVGAFTRGLASGKNGSYFGVSPEEYQTSLVSAQSAIPQGKQLPFEPAVTPEPKADTDMVLAPASPPSPPTPPQSDKSGAKPGERFLGAAIGTGVGTVATGLQGFGDQRTAVAVKRAGLEEAARIAAQRAAATPAIPPGSPGVQGQSVKPILSGGLDAGRLPGMQAPVTGSAPASPIGGPSSSAGASPQAVRIQQGTTGDLGTTGRARMTGFNTETSQMSEAQKAAYARAQVLKNMGVVAQDAPEFFSRQPGMTSSPAGVLFPRSEIPPATTVGPRGPEGQIGGGRPPTPPPIPSVLAGATPGEVSFRPPVPPPSSMAQIAKTGLDTVTDLFKGMMRPVVSAVGTVGKYAVAPLAGLSAGLDAAELANEYGKKENQRDYTKMALKGASIVGGGLSMFPPTAAVGIPLSLGATAAQAYREDPQYYKQKMKEYTGYSP